MSNIEPIKSDQKLLNLIHTKHPGFHPALVLADVAADEDTDTSLRVQAAKSLMPYVTPQLKSMEIFGEVRHDHGLLRVSVNEPEPIEAPKEMIEIGNDVEDDSYQDELVTECELVGELSVDVTSSVIDVEIDEELDDEDDDVVDMVLNVFESD